SAISDFILAIRRYAPAPMVARGGLLPVPPSPWITLIRMRPMATRLCAICFFASWRPELISDAAGPSESSRNNRSLGSGPAEPVGVSAAGHAANAGTNTSGVGGLYSIEAWDLIVLWWRRQLSMTFSASRKVFRIYLKIAGRSRSAINVG